MNKHASSLLLLGLPVLVGASALPGCSDSGEATTPAPEAPNTNIIPVAMVISLSGPAKAIGDESKRGAEVAVAQINALGGVLGKKLELIIENDSSDPVQTRQKVVALVERGIKLGIGPSTSTAAERMKDLIAADRVLYVSPSATSKILDQVGSEAVKESAPGEPPTGPVFFRTAATDVFLSAALSQYASNSEIPGGPRRCPNIVLVKQNDTYGQPIADAVARYYGLLGLSIKRTVELDPTVDNAAKLVSAAEAAGAAATAGTTTDANCQVVVAQPEVAGAYMREFRKYRSSVQNAAKRNWSTFVTVGSDGVRQDEFIVAGRIDAADTQQETAGEGSIAVAADTAPETPEYSAFLNLFRARFPDVAPGRYGSTAYDAVILLAAAIERSKTTESLPQIRGNLYLMSKGRLRVGPNKLTDMFDFIRRGEDLNYEGASGTLDFEPSGHVRSAFGVWKIQNAAFVKVTQFDVSELGSGN